MRVVGRIVDGGSLVAPITGRTCVSFDAVILRPAAGGPQIVTRGMRGDAVHRRRRRTGKILVDPRGAYIQVVYDHSEVGPLDLAKVSDPEFVAEVGGASELRFDEGVLTIGEQVSVTGLVTAVARRRRGRLPAAGHHRPAPDRRAGSPGGGQRARRGSVSHPWPRATEAAAA
ncbi:MAG: hypothetical protein HS111_03120 [Kofleriaceae bacterium]|nr:hypothetical protein [Kofleriaceae bacterium]